MTHHETQLKAAYQRSGLSFQGKSFDQAMSIKAIRIALECAVKASTKGKPAPIQPGLIYGVMMINRETIWYETYMRNVVHVDATTDVEVFTAIHHNKAEQRLDLVAELQIEFASAGGRFYNKVFLDPEQMEALAQHLQDAAKAQRLMLALLDSDKASAQTEAA